MEDSIHSSEPIRAGNSSGTQLHPVARTKAIISKETHKPGSRKKSDVHKYFCASPTRPFYMRCLTCAREIKSDNGSTSGMRRHVKSFHTGHDLGPDTRVKKSKRVKLMSSPAKVTVKTVSAPKLNKKMTLTTTKKSKDYIVDYLIRDGNFVEDLAKTGLNQLLQQFKVCINHDYLERLHQNVSERHKLAVASIKEIFQNDAEVSTVSVFIDSWSADVFEGYLSIGVQYLSAEFQLKKHILSCSKVMDSSYSEIIADKIYSVLNDFGIVKKVKFITGENSHEMSEAIAIVRNKILGNENPVGIGFPSLENFHIVCLGKLLNSYSKQVVEAFEPTLSKLRAFSKYWSLSNTLSQSWDSAAVKSIQGSRSFLSSLKQENIELGRKLIPPPYIINNWKSVLEFIHQITKDGKLILTAQNEVSKNNSVPEHVLLKKTDIRLANVVKELLEDFKLFVDISSKENTVSLSSRKVGFDKLLSTIENVRETISEINFANSLKNYVKDINLFFSRLKSRIKEDSDTLLSTQTFQLSELLDKRFPNKNVHSSKEWQKDYQNLVTYLQEQDYTPVIHKARASPLDLLQVAQQMQSTSEEKATEIVKEVTEFLDRTSVHPQEDVLNWWKNNATDFPRLAAAAREILACPSTSCSDNVIFSHDVRKDMDGQIGRDRTFIKRMELKSWIWS
eukprot:augustus_masked-scaffold_5-processed-gene-4.45-mRNA-1 protein AED:1.00 eAED:1.00 QI:0/-1/0/0/-1/1/1/0/675